MKHTSVLLKETVDSLNVKEDGIYVDGTLGRGGHSGYLISKLKSGHLYAFDKDSQAIAESTENLKDVLSYITMIHNDFRSMKEELAKRGFSYRYDARLDMRMNQEQELDAYQIVNTYSFEELCRILREYGEEKFTKPIARAIEKQRAIRPIETTFQLVDVIKSALPDKVLRQKGHPAKQTFQALRIEVNDELGALQKGLEEALSLLKPHGRCAIITFHSLEDRMVKSVFKDYSSAPYIDPRIPIKASDIKQADYNLITKKPITATDEELEENHRSHSAKLRVIEKKGE